MADAPAHKFGQIIGNLLEDLIWPLLVRFCDFQGLYLDHKSNDRPARSGKKVAWEDNYGNTHDLDYVIEQGGTDKDIGRPIAFIEVAWRRYTKHSRNKAQEIQGAILPLAEKYKWNNPFLGVVLAGVFTGGSIEQLKSHGFSVLYFQYETLVDGFKKEGIDIQFDEATPNEDFIKCVELLETSSEALMQRVKDNLIKANKDGIKEFFDAIKARLGRRVEKVIVVPLYGQTNEFLAIEEALDFLDQDCIEATDKFMKYEVLVSFSNGDKVEGTFTSKQKAREFLIFVSNQ